MFNNRIVQSLIWVLLVCFYMVVGQICFGAINPYVSVSNGQSNDRKEMYSAPTYSATIGMETKRFGTNFSIGYLSQANKIQSLQEGRITLIPLIISVYVRTPITNRLSFYGGVGSGWAIASFDLDEKYYRTADQYAHKIKVTTKDGMATQAMGGFDYRLTRNVSFGLSASYFFFNTTVTQSTEWRDRYYHKQASSQTLTLDGVSVLASLKYTWR